jgi:YidC/Oxa1 family membrane protein insertase
MDFVNLLCSAWPDGFWPSLIKIFDFVGSYAWTIILFTVALKLVLLPMDFLQRYFTNKSSRAQAKLQPQLEKLKKQYGQNQNLLYQKQNELYQKNGTGMKSSCLVMVIYMALTLTIFITLWSSMQSIAAFKIKAQYQELQTTYYTSYNTDYLEDYLGIDLVEYENAEDKVEFVANKETAKATSLVDTDDITTEEATSAVASFKADCVSTAETLVFNEYDSIKDSWLWIKNIWRSDKLTVNAILTYSDYSAYDDTVTEDTYNAVMNKLLNDESGVNGANGYYILSAIVLVVTFLSQWLTKKLSQVKTKGQKVQTQMGAMKFLMYLLPFTMLIFTLNSSAIFAVYIITNSIMSTLITPLTTLISNKIEDKRELKKVNLTKVDYRR